MDKPFPGKEFAEVGKRVSVYCLGGHVITGVIKKATADIVAIDRDGTDYLIITPNIVAFSQSRDDK